MLGNPLAGLVSDEVCRVAEFVELGFPGLWCLVTWIMLAVLAPELIRKLWMPCIQQAQPIAKAFIGMVVAQNHVSVPCDIQIQRAGLQRL
jgi:hypothetical protein